MKEHPILFSGEMVRAILDGRKTQTRRVIKAPKWSTHERAGVDYGCPCGTAGDMLWGRENFSPCGCSACEAAWPNKTKHNVIYQATNQMADLLFRPSIYMPRWASRITLEITDIRVERVQDITEQDARAEGVGVLIPTEASWWIPDRPYASMFRNLWESINLKRGYGWDSNPWVWVIKFARCK